MSLNDSNEKYLIGVDVGTQSVRAGLVSVTGVIQELASKPIKTHNPAPGIYEQSSEEIWSLCVAVIKEVAKNVSPNSIRGIGFDATCSLAVLDDNFRSLCVSKSGEPGCNVILWMDHRAVEEANFINSKKNKVLQFVGGKISPEMEPPKLLWIKKNMPEQWKKAGHFFDLPDFLTFKATGSLESLECWKHVYMHENAEKKKFVRISLCSLVCKWTYQANEACKEWHDDFWIEIGLDDLVSDRYDKIGTKVLPPGEPCGKGLCECAARDMGLLPGTPVSASIIDAHAGGIGVLSCAQFSGAVGSLDEKLALISGTSTCHMKVNKTQIFVPGVWGPYFSAMVPEYWCSEAGQSAAGALIDHVINSHLSTALHFKQMSTKLIAEALNKKINELAAEKGLLFSSCLTEDFHMYPDFHGNRSPLANPSLKGMLCGLELSSNIEDLAKHYLSCIQALAYSTKHIISSLEEKGHVIKCLLVCGGLAKNPLYVQTHSDVTGLPVVVPNSPEPVLLGCAMLGASASGIYPSVYEAMAAMSGDGSIILPHILPKEFHNKKYEVFLSMLKCQLDIQRIMV